MAGRDLRNKCKRNEEVGVGGGPSLPSVNADIEMVTPEMSTMVELDQRLLHYVV